MTECFLDFLNEQEVEYYRQYKISRLSSIGIGGNADIVAIPDTTEAMINLIRYLYKNRIKYKLVGSMTNILPTDADYNGVLIKTSRLAIYYTAENECVALCGAKTSRMLVELAALGLGGAEELYGIPGSVGGMIVGNAGAYGIEMADILLSVEVYDPITDTVRHIPKEELDFSYRNSALKGTELVILSARLSFKPKDRTESIKRIGEISALRKSTQPYNERSLGSIFKRCEGAPISHLIDKCGLKGCRVGGAEISKKHAGFIVNRGGATEKDVRALIEIIKNRLYSDYKIMPTEEIEYLL